MLELTVTPNRAGLTLWGDYECLKRLHEFIHRLTEKSGYIGTKDGFVLGLAYDVRKAFQGQRSQDTYTFDILPVLKDGDSFCKTAMPGRENVPGGIHITMM